MQFANGEWKRIILTIREPVLVCFRGIPPSVAGIQRLLTLFSTFGFSRETIARFFKLLVELEKVGCLLVEITGLLELGCR